MMIQTKHVFPALAAVALFSLTSAQANAQVDSLADTDGDGIIDKHDIAPCDPDVTGLIHYPGDRVWGQLMFEDEWPNNGDSDYNDLVASYNQIIKLNASGQISGLKMVLHIMAVGAKFKNGLAIRLPGIRTDQVEGLEFDVVNGSGDVGLDQTAREATVVFTEDLHKIFGVEKSREWVNTDDRLEKKSFAEISFKVKFKPGARLAPNATPPYDIYLFNTERDTEVHLPQFSATERIRLPKFGTKDDGSSSANGRYFVNKRGVPFALNMPEIVNYPREGRRFDALYPEILEFGASAGLRKKTFYRNRARGTGKEFALTHPRSIEMRKAADTSCFPVPPGECGHATEAAAVKAPLPGRDTCKVPKSESIHAHVDTGIAHSAKLTLDMLTPESATSMISVSPALNRYEWTCRGAHTAAVKCSAPIVECDAFEREECTTEEGLVGSRECNSTGNGYGPCEAVRCAPSQYVRAPSVHAVAHIMSSSTIQPHIDKSMSLVTTFDTVHNDGKTETLECHRQACSPGMKQACATPEGSGTQACDSSGTGFGPCVLNRCNDAKVTYTAVQADPMLNRGTDTMMTGPVSSFKVRSASNLCVAESSCSDGFQNQGEVGIDCGGPCQNKCSVAQILMAPKSVPAAGIPGPVYTNWMQCAGYLDRLGQNDDIPNKGWAGGCDRMDRVTHVRIACGSSTTNVRYIDVDVSGLNPATSYPHSGAITGRSWMSRSLADQIFTDIGSPLEGTSWFLSGSGCDEDSESLIINEENCVNAVKGTQAEVANCFGLGLHGQDRYLWLYTRSDVKAPQFIAAPASGLIKGP